MNGLCHARRQGGRALLFHFCFKTSANADIEIGDALSALARTYRDTPVIGRSNLVGRPLVQLLLNENATVTSAHSRSRDLPQLCARADLVYAAVGKPEMVRAGWIKAILLPTPSATLGALFLLPARRRKAVIG